MGVANDIFIVTVGIMFIYLVIYKKNRLFGNLGYMGCGLAMMSYSQGNISSAIGLVILLGSLVNGIYDAMTPKRKG